MRPYEHRMRGTKRALLRATVTNMPSKRSEVMGRNTLKVEQLTKLCEVLAGMPLGEDLGVTDIIGLCRRDFNDRLDLVTQDTAYAEVLDAATRPAGLGLWMLTITKPITQPPSPSWTCRGVCGQTK